MATLYTTPAAAETTAHIKYYKTSEPPPATGEPKTTGQIRPRDH